MSRKRFEAISKCLHVNNNSGAPTDRNHPDFDKLAKLRWLIEEVRECCINNWNLGQFVTIDELMVRYKGGYGHGMKQYMPNNDL